jgi:hypothetical protein
MLSTRLIMHLAPVHGGPMMHSALTECAGCRVLTIAQLEREQTRNATMAMEWQRSTNELVWPAGAPRGARQGRRPRAEADTPKLFEARYLAKQLKHVR